MKISTDVLAKITQENINEQMIESFCMGSGLKNQIITKLFNGEEVALPQEIETYLIAQIPNWINQNIERKKKKIAA